MKQIEQQVKETLLTSPTRISYLALNMQWMTDQLAAPSRSQQGLLPIHLTVRPFHTLDNELLPRSTVVDQNPVKHAEEELQVRAYVLPASHFMHRNTSNHDHKQLAELQRKSYQATIDHFFSLNPCWVPLHEPVMYDQSTLIATATATENTDEKQRDSRQLLILAHLPRHGFLPTCLLFEALVTRQSPPICQYSSSHMRSFPLGNIGWAHVFNFLVNAFVSQLSSDVFAMKRVLVAPVAHQFMQRMNQPPPVPVTSSPSTTSSSSSPLSLSSVSSLSSPPPPSSTTTTTASSMSFLSFLWLWWFPETTSNKNKSSNQDQDKGSRTNQNQGPDSAVFSINQSNWTPPPGLPDYFPLLLPGSHIMCDAHFV